MAANIKAPSTPFICYLVSDWRRDVTLSAGEISLASLIAGYALHGDPQPATLGSSVG